LESATHIEGGAAAVIVDMHGYDDIERSPCDSCADSIPPLTIPHAYSQNVGGACAQELAAHKQSASVPEIADGERLNCIMRGMAERGDVFKVPSGEIAQRGVVRCAGELASEVNRRALTIVVFSDCLDPSERDASADGGPGRAIPAGDAPGSGAA